MSLILEALKKSEANRRLGQAPDLGTPFTPARRERSPVWALLVIVLSLGAGLWWWFGRGVATPVPVKVPDVAQSPSPVRSAPSLRKPSPAIQAATSSGAAPARRENEQIWVAAQRGPAERPAQPVPPPAAPTPPAPAPTASATPPAQPARTAKSADTHGYAPPPQPARAAKTADTHGYTPPPQPHPESAPAQPTPAVPKLDVPTYYDLPFAMRKALPQLSLSMHVYTADPKQRFVILDGTRMAEGDATPDNITVREIRPDGVVLEFQGQRFFYPRDGL